MGRLNGGVRLSVLIFPEGPGIEKIRSRPSELIISSDRSWIEIFDRALVCTPRGPHKYRTPGLKFSIGIEMFDPGLGEMFDRD